VLSDEGAQALCYEDNHGTQEPVAYFRWRLQI